MFFQHLTVLTLLRTIFYFILFLFSRYGVGGVCMWNMGYVLKCKELYELENFPFDRQDLQIELRQDDSSTWDDFDLTVFSVLFHKHALELSEWETYEPKIEKSSHKATTILLQVRRIPTFYVTNVVLVMLMLSLLGFTAFALPPDALSDRIDIMLTLLLTAVAFKFVIADAIPKVGYNTHLDNFVMMNMAFLFFAAAVCVAGSLTESLDDTSLWTTVMLGVRWDMNRAMTMVCIFIFLFINITWAIGVKYALESEIDLKPIKLVDGTNWYNFLFANPGFLPRWKVDDE